MSSKSKQKQKKSFHKHELLIRSASSSCSEDEVKNSKSTTVAHYDESAGAVGAGSEASRPSAAARNAQDEERTRSVSDPFVPPEACFHALEKVYARDDDGLLYHAVVRRSLFGAAGPKQCKLGYISLEESDYLGKLEDPNEPSWHYFLHFDGWNVKWDRWVGEENIFRQDNPVVKQYAQILVQEHKDLRITMAGGGNKAKSKKGRASIDSTKFLQAWRKVVDRLDAEYQIPNPQLDQLRGVTHSKVPESMKEVERFKNQSAKKNAKRGAFNSNNDDSSNNKKDSNNKNARKRQRAAMLEQEQALRRMGLTKLADSAVSQKILLPRSLKKVLVDQWEIICQCNMLATIPAPITVRDALNEYLRSKGVLILPPAATENHCQQEAAGEEDGKPAAIVGLGRARTPTNTGSNTSSEDAEILSSPPGDKAKPSCQKELAVSDKQHDTNATDEKQTDRKSATLKDESIADQETTMAAAAEEGVVSFTTRTEGKRTSIQLLTNGLHTNETSKTADEMVCSPSSSAKRGSSLQLPDTNGSSAASKKNSSTRSSINGQKEHRSAPTISSMNEVDDDDDNQKKHAELQAPCPVEDPSQFLLAVPAEDPSTVRPFQQTTSLAEHPVSLRDVQDCKTNSGGAKIKSSTDESSEAVRDTKEPSSGEEKQPNSTPELKRNKIGRFVSSSDKKLETDKKKSETKKENMGETARSTSTGGKRRIGLKRERSQSKTRDTITSVDNVQDTSANDERSSGDKKKRSKKMKSPSTEVFDDANAAMEEVSDSVANNIGLKKLGSRIIAADVGHNEKEAAKKTSAKAELSKAKSTTPATPVAATILGEEGAEERREEWMEMADGIAMFFDEAIENLLYREEQAQFRTIQNNIDGLKDKKPYSELYGTEHLLRLVVRLPELLSESDLPPNEVRIILAKVNDLVRFLHKNQANLFGLRHERPSAEILQAAKEVYGLDK